MNETTINAYAVLYVHVAVQTNPKVFYKKNRNNYLKMDFDK